MEAKQAGEERQPSTEHAALQETTTQDAPAAGYPGEEEGSAIDRQYASTPPEVPRRVYMLGTGSIGKLVAHALKGIAKPPPITLLLHRQGLLKTWEEGRKEITVNDDGYNVPRSGFDVELVQPPTRQHGVVQQAEQETIYEVSDRDPRQRPHQVAEQMKAQQRQQSKSPARRNETAESDEPIHNLIVTTKAAHTVSALSSIRHRLSSESTICFLQNGMGIVDEVNKELFPEEDQRPSYIQGIITHGANSPPGQDPFYVIHAGHGSIALGLLPRDGLQNAKAEKNDQAIQNERWPQSSRYLLRTLTRCPVLCAVGFTPLELFQQQLEKLAMNSIINPLTALLDNRNGSLLYNFALTRTMRLLLAETSNVICNLPELQGVANVKHRFSTERLETVVVSMAEKTKDNISSMLADVRAGKQTEIEYINGYIVKRGEELGYKCVVNYAIMQTVIGKSNMTQRERSEEVPMEDGRR